MTKELTTYVITGTVEDLLVSDVINCLIEHAKRRDVVVFVGSTSQKDALDFALEGEASLDVGSGAAFRFPAAVRYRR